VRLELRRKLTPYTTLLELADDLDVTLPHLKRRLRELEAKGELTLESLVASLGSRRLPVKRDDLFLSFHRRQLCLVCGSRMEQVRSHQPGWGEFKQCPFCLFSAHENADFEKLRELATSKLDELDTAFREANRIFTQRTKKGRALKLESS
jgi:hypothetical protein